MLTFILHGLLLNVYETNCLIIPSWTEPECPGVECQPIDYNTCTCPCLTPSCSGNDTSDWPLGNYALPASMYGCPEASWEARYINMTLPSDSADIFWESDGTNFFYQIGYGIEGRYQFSHTKDLHILGPYSKRNFQLNICVRDEEAPNSNMGVRGHFCVFKTGKECNYGFEEGNITLRGYKINVRGFNSPVTTEDDGVILSFCCRNDKIKTLSKVLPQTSSFVLIKGPSGEFCDLIRNMTVTEDVLYLPVNDMDVEFNGTLPNMTASNTHIKISFCVYFPLQYKVGISADIDISDLKQNDLLQSLQKPCYSSPYEETTDNNLKFVVDGSWGSNAGLYFTSDRVHRPWLQIDLQEFINVKYILKETFKESGLPGVSLYGVYVSKDQWNFINHGAVACFFGVSITKFVCRRPVVGQYVTIVREADNDVRIRNVLELEVYGDSSRCGRYLGMISGDIKEYQIDTSNKQDIQYTRALFSTRGWCASQTDMERWIMVDLILPTTVQGVALHGWFQYVNLFINSFMIGYGVRQNNMLLYGEPGFEPKVFQIDTSQHVYVMQKFWFWKERTARFVKIIMVDFNPNAGCLKMEIIGCDIYKRRSIQCEKEQRNGQSIEAMDFGFASVKHKSFYFGDNPTENDTNCYSSDVMFQEFCQLLTVHNGFLGNMYKDNECCLYNISSTNRHYKHLWNQVPEEGSIVSERLCLSEIVNPVNIRNRELRILSALGSTDSIYSLMFPSSYPKGFKTEVTYKSTFGLFLKLTVVYVSFSETASKAQLIEADHPEINPGYCKDQMTIDVGTGNEIHITRDNQERYRHASFISRWGTIKIVFASCIQYTTSLEDNVYELHIETVGNPGCGIDGTQQVSCTARTANIASFLYPSLYTSSDSNVWKIRGMFGQYIELKFIDLDVSFTYSKTTGTRIIHSFVEVFDFGLDKVSSSMGRYYIETKPRAPLVSSWHMMDIEFRVGGDETGRGFFGLYSIVDIVSYSISKSPDCLDTWYSFQKSCYKLFENTTLDHQKAEIECVRNGGHLVAISSEAEMKFVHQLLTEMSFTSVLNYTEVQVYIGLTKKNSGYMFSDFQWTNGEPLIYTAWFSGKGKNSQPDGFSSEQCTAIIMDSIQNKHNWHDVPCAFDLIHYFMCEIHPNTSKTVKMDGSQQSALYSSQPIQMKENMNRCDSGEIVSQFVVCDGHPDCSDKSDEFHCDKTGCTSSQFTCDNNQCIHLTFYCDGISHCDDASDEKDCELPRCKDGEWQCENKHCIPEDNRCDNKVDCYDKSDEYNCESCSSESFQCFDKSCISSSRKCDVLPDCPGRYLEDETDCSEYNTQRSCGDWWNMGVRSDGMYRIDYGERESHSVYCQFTETKDILLTTTSFYYNEIGFGGGSNGLESTEYKFFQFDKDMIMSMSQNKEYTCSQKVKIRCYFHDVVTDNVELFLKACIDGCQCIGQYNWRQADVNKVFVNTMIFTDPSNLPVNSHVVSQLSYSNEGFYDFDVGPVVCTSETLKNSSTDKYLCSNGNLYDTEQACRMQFNEYKDIIGCRDMSHIQHCGNVDCQESFFKCSDDYCLSPNLVCDGIKQCQNGEDEQKCENFSCPGLFRCQKSTTCLLHDDVCNGIIDCPFGDDEIACNIKCPSGCNCDGLVIMCQHNQLENIIVPIQARKLDFSHSRFKRNITKFPFSYLAELILWNCSIEIIEVYAFEALKNLLLLDLRQNKFNALYRDTFRGLHRLRYLKLAGNALLTKVEPTAFIALDNVRQLYLIGTGIKQIKSNTFTGLRKLEILNISNNEIISIQQNAFYGLDSLRSIDLSKNDITEYTLNIFSSLHHISEIRSDSYTLCCLKPDSVDSDRCFPQMDEFSSCTDLMRVDVLRICLWIIGIMALFGNLGVMVYRLKNERHTLGKAHGFFVMNLGFSDMLMGIYLCMIAVADLYFKGDYILHDKDWRDSIVCKVAGIIAAISCEASVNFILLITIDCFLLIKFPFGERKISKRMARVSSLICWIIVILIGIFPVLYTSYFSQRYYSKTAVCLALPFSRQRSKGWEYSTIIFVFYNCIVFGIIACCQISIYNVAKSGNRVMAKRTNKDLVLATRLFLVVLTDFMCWIPIGIMGILALTGEVFPADVYSWVAVFVMPVNAALNPFLYTFSNVWTKQKMKVMSSVSTTMFKVSKMKQNSRDSSDSVFVASTFIKSMNELTVKFIPLKDLYNHRKLSPGESYLLCTQLLTAITYLHHRFLTFRKRISPENVLVLLEHKGMVRIKIVSKIQEVKKEDDVSKDIEDIGILAKHILRCTLLPKQNIQRD